MDANKYNPSLFDTADGECYICKSEVPTERHEIYGGANRSNSKKYGMWINVCPSCHRISPHSIHSEPRKHERLKAEGQRLFEIEYPDKSFYSVFLENHL